jgi:hypothetical protein
MPFYISTIMKNLIFIIYILCPFLLLSQKKHDANWLFGYEKTYGTKINFQKDSFLVIDDKDKSPVASSGIAYSDKNGNLLYYSNGCAIFDKDNKVIANGDNLETSFLENYCNRGFPLSDMNIFLNFDNNDSLYMVQTTAKGNNKIGVGLNFFLISIKNSKLILKKTLSIDSIKLDNIKATRHANGIDWWVIANDFEYRSYYSILLKKNGSILISPNTYSAKGMSEPSRGQCCFSPNGEKYVRSDFVNNMQVYDFDRCTGKLSNEKIIKYSSSALGDANGVCISPNNRFLYQSYNRKLLQFDLLASDLKKSEVLIDTFDNFYDGILPVTFYTMANGADGRIFMSCTSGVEYLHLINKPNEKGKACDFRQHSIKLTGYNTNMSNHPNYRLGPSSVICTTATGDLNDITLNIYPNPAQDVLHLESESGEAIKRVVVYNAIGEQVYVSDYQGVDKLDINTSTFQNGMYVLRVQYQNLQVSSAKVSILR